MVIFHPSAFGASLGYGWGGLSVEQGKGVSGVALQFLQALVCVVVVLLVISFWSTVDAIHNFSRVSEVLDVMRHNHSQKRCSFLVLLVVL